VPPITCPACGLSRNLPSALVASGARELRCPRCGRDFVAGAAPPPEAPSRAPPEPSRWRPVAGWQAGALALGAALLWNSIRTRGLLFAVISGADLVFHEAGHLVLGLLGWPLLTFLGGALGQLAFPVAAAAIFARRGQAASLAAAIVWVGFNVLEIGRYAADGRVRALPLLAPDANSHDWWNILGILGLRESAEAIGGAIQALGWAAMLWAPAWLAWRWWSRWRAPA
jgi:hypothetical protein